MSNKNLSKIRIFQIIYKLINSFRSQHKKLINRLPNTEKDRIFKLIKSDNQVKAFQLKVKNLLEKISS